MLIRWRARPGNARGAPGFAEQCRQLTEARRENEWLAAGNADVQQQALKDFSKAKNARFTSGFGEPTWRKKHGLIWFEKLNVTNMTRSAKGTVDQPGTRVRQKAGLNRVILAQGWGLLRQRTQDKAPGRVEDVPAPFTSLRCSACGWIEKKSRKSQADFVCVSCGFTCNADENAATNVAAGQGGFPRPRRSAGAGGMTAATGCSNIREPQPTRVGIPLIQ